MKIDMQELFLTSTRPVRRYRSERFFVDFLGLRFKTFYGKLEGRYGSNFRRMLILKKFFRWYYHIPSVRFFRKLVGPASQSLLSRVQHRNLLSFFHILEKNILIGLFRCGFTKTLLEGVSAIRSQMVYVNGSRVSVPFYILRHGDVVEMMREFAIRTFFRRKVLAFSIVLQRYRLNYLLPTIMLFFLNWNRKINFSPKKAPGAFYKKCLIYLKKIC